MNKSDIIWFLVHPSTKQKGQNLIKNVLKACNRHLKLVEMSYGWSKCVENKSDWLLKRQLKVPVKFPFLWRKEFNHAPHDGSAFIFRVTSRQIEAMKLTFCVWTLPVITASNLCGVSPLRVLDRTVVRSASSGPLTQPPPSRSAHPAPPFHPVWAEDAHRRGQRSRPPLERTRMDEVFCADVGTIFFWAIWWQSPDVNRFNEWIKGYMEKCLKKRTQNFSMLFPLWDPHPAAAQSPPVNLLCWRTTYNYITPLYYTHLWVKTYQNVLFVFGFYPWTSIKDAKAWAAYSIHDASSYKEYNQKFFANILPENPTNSVFQFRIVGRSCIKNTAAVLMLMTERWRKRVII